MNAMVSATPDELKVRTGATINSLFQEHLEFAGIVAKRYVRTRAAADFDVVLSFAREGLFAAACRFEPSIGVPFRSYAASRVLGAILDGMRQERAIHRRALERRRSAAGIEEFACGMAAAQASGLLPQNGIETDEGDVFVAAYGDPESQLIEHEERRRLTRRVATLGERASALIARHYFDGHRFDEVATELGISKSWASRIHTSAVVALRESFANPENRMVHIVSATPIGQLSTGNQLFRCEPYNCTMLARACVERQAKVAIGIDPIGLMKCNGCALGVQVKERATDVGFTERELLRGVRSTHHRAGELGKKLRGARMNPTPDAPAHQKQVGRRALPIIGLDYSAPPTPPPLELPPAFRTRATQNPAPVAVTETQPRNEGPMPSNIDLEGKELAGVKVLRPMPKEKGQKGAVWWVRFKPCGHEDSVIGFLLTSAEKKGTVRHCKICKEAKRAGGKPMPEPKASDAPRAKAPKSAPRKGPQERPALPTAARALSGPAEAKVYEFPLRRDFAATVTLPTNLTMHDVERFTRWMETLVFEDAVAAE